MPNTNDTHGPSHQPNNEGGQGGNDVSGAPIEKPVAKVSGTFESVGSGAQTYVRSGRMATLPRNTNDGAGDRYDMGGSKEGDRMFVSPMPPVGRKITDPLRA